MRGSATLGPLTYATASYTAGYVLKKMTADDHQTTHALYGAETEPLTIRDQEWNTMSKGSRRNKGGLGYDWFQKYWPDVYPSDTVELDGKSFRPPAYYDRLLKMRDPALHAEVLAKRKEHTDARGLTSDLELHARGVTFSQRMKLKKQRSDL